MELREVPRVRRWEAGGALSPDGRAGVPGADRRDRVGALLLMASTPALSASSADAPFVHTTIERRELGEREGAIDVKYCGICHSDIHQVKDEWGGSIYPMVPGHEIAGVVTAVGSAVEKLSVGDRVGVGCLVDSCEECEYCKAGEEQFCVKRAVPTYNGRDYDGEPTYGGYSQRIVVKDRFLVRT